MISTFLTIKPFHRVVASTPQGQQPSAVFSALSSPSSSTALRKSVDRRRAFSSFVVFDRRLHTTHRFERKAFEDVMADDERNAPCTVREEGAKSTPEGANSTPEGAVDFLTLIQSLKVTKRTGWIRKGIDGPESIADHMYRMSIMALIAGDNEGLDHSRCMKIALAHDMAEALVGDITPHDNVTKEDKEAMERTAMQKMTSMLGKKTGDHLLALWEEYEAGTSPEAKLLKDLDKLEMILQAQEYESSQSMDLNEFFTSTQDKFQTKTGIAWAAEISRRRPASSKEDATKEESNETDAKDAKKQRVE